MNKRLKLSSIVITLLIVLVIVLHFVPVDSHTGYVDVKGSSAENLPTVNYDYRWISGGVNAWDDQLSHLHEGGVLDTIGMQKAHIRLYLF